MSFDSIGDPKYIALETFRSNGEAVNTPVWVVREDDKLYVWTQGDSWKVKRIRNNSRVRIAISNARGVPSGEWIEARARVLDASEDEARIRQQMVGKYGLMFRLFTTADRIRRSKQNRVVLEISDPQSLNDPESLTAS